MVKREGLDLESVNKKSLFIVLIVGIAIVAIIGHVKNEESKKTDLAVLQYYADMEAQKAAGTNYAPTSNTNTIPTNDLEIQDGWTWEYDNGYDYVRGRVKNIGVSNISYFKITAEYMDSNGNVLDTDYTNDGEMIRSGNMKEFEIMHKSNPEHVKVRIFVEEVNRE